MSYYIIFSSLWADHLIEEVKLACLRDPTSCAGWDFCLAGFTIPDWSKGKGLTAACATKREEDR